MNIQSFLRTTLSLSLIAALVGCSSMTPKERDYTIAGAVIGGAGAVLLQAPAALSILAAAAGAGIGYYVSLPQSVHPDAIVKAEGMVFQQGDYTTIIIPSDHLFDMDYSNDLLPSATPLLESAVTIAKQFPDENILITGNTDNLNAESEAVALSTQQAQKVASFFAAHGIADSNSRHLQYAGLGDQSPIANSHSQKGMKQNRRIQITIYPS